MKRFLAAISASLLVLTPFISLFNAPVAQAAVSSWVKGAAIVPTNTTDFASGNMQQSLRNLKATGANYVALVVPYYQSNTGSTDIAPGWNTPTDAALGSAIDYAHSIGLQVAIKVHNEVYTGDWRAYINPGDRNTWFNNYNNELVHIGQVAAAHHAEMYILGTEMVSVASAQVNGDNTERWQSIIANVRKVYGGTLTYDANSTNNNGDPFENEKASIGFWSSLDMAGLSAYYNLNSSNDVNSLMGQWDYWNKNDLQGFASRVGKPIFFAEIGYKSVSNAHTQPWNSGLGGGYDPTEQANDYQALMQYWNNYSYMQGVLWWDWKVDPNAGGSGNTDYTPQNKPAQQTLTQWFTSAPSGNGGGTTTPPPSGGGSTGNPIFTTSAAANPAGPSVGTADTLTASISNTGGTLTNAIVDIEVYDSNNTKIMQKFYQNQTLTAGQTQTFTANWTPSAAGQYRVTVGVFNSDWSHAYTWNSNAAAVTVGQTAGNPPPANTPPPTNNPPPSTTPTGTYTTNVWWPTNGATVSGVQPFKANIPGLDVSQYSMFWQVDGGQLNQMFDNQTDYPHKEADVNLSGWNWNSTHQYKLNFVSKNSSGSVISQQGVTITVQ